MAELILVRHTEAEKEETTDSARKLTRKGHKQAKILSNILLPEINKFDLYVHSGIVRSEQTLNLILGDNHTFNTMQTSTLEHETKAIEFAKWLKIHADDLKKVMVVGHEPQLSRFLSWAIARSDQVKFRIKKGCLIRLHISEFSELLTERMQLVELTSNKTLKSAHVL